MTTVIYPIIKEVNYDRCLARHKKDLTKQCNYKSRENGLCGHCGKRKIKPPLVTEEYEKPIEKKRKRGKLKLMNFITPGAMKMGKNHSVKSLKFTLQKLKLSYKSTDRKPALVYKLEQYYEGLYNYIDKIKEVNCIIRSYRNYHKRKMINLRGPGYLDPSVCVNETDFFTCEELVNLDKSYLFTYSNNDTIYGFDMRSFKKLLEFSKENPYDKTSITEEVITNFNNLYDAYGDRLEVIETPTLTKEQKLDQKILSTFDILDKMNYYTDMEWFKGLTKNKLLLFYVEAEDIWNYRAGLSYSAQKNILPTGKAFSLAYYRKPKKELLLMNRRKLQDECLKEIEALTTNGKTEADRVLGALYIMSALVMVSRGAYMAYPHLWNPSTLCPYHP